jgi:flagellar basal-body rod protein FlgG
MNHSMIAASVSMAALQRKLDLIADNVANVNTVGYKSKSGVFEEILSGIQPQEPDFAREGRRTPFGFPMGGGARMVGIRLDLTPGTPQQTGLPTDLMLEGNGLFELRTAEGGRVFTRHGAFQWQIDDAGNRWLVTSSGYRVVNDDDEPIVVPAGYEWHVAGDGTMTAVSPAGDDVLELGILKVVQPVRADLLRAVGDNLLAVADGVDPDEAVVPLDELPAGAAGVTVRQGYLEASNVDLIAEMTELTNALRAYQLSARALASGEQMLQMAANLRG